MLSAVSANIYAVGNASTSSPELADGVRHGAGRGGGAGFLVPLLLIALLGFLFFRIMRRGRHGYAVSHGAMGTLSDRFARGDITREEFEYRRAVLNKDKDIPPAPPFAQRPASDAGDLDPEQPEGQ